MQGGEEAGRQGGREAGRHKGMQEGRHAQERDDQHIQHKLVKVGLFEARPCHLHASVLACRCGYARVCVRSCMRVCVHVRVCVHTRPETRNSIQMKPAMKHAMKHTIITDVSLSPICANVSERAARRRNHHTYQLYIGSWTCPYTFVKYDNPSCSSLALPDAVWRALGVAPPPPPPSVYLRMPRCMRM